MLVLANGRYPEAGIESFIELCSSRGLILIEDAAQALGSRYLTESIRGQWVMLEASFQPQNHFYGARWCSDL